MHYRSVPGGRLVLPAVLISLCCARADAADYEIRASGPFVTADVTSGTFDGSADGTLSPILDAARLAGGTFSAVYRFNTVTPGSSGQAFYELDPTSGITFDLFDNGGTLVHRATLSTEPISIVANNFGGAPFTIDQVLLSANVSGISGQMLPTPLYTPPGDLFSAAEFSFSGNVSSGDDVIADFAIPTDAATYLRFPNKVFDVIVGFGDGDYNDRVGPFQAANVFLQYDVTALTVTAVPEPGGLTLLALAAGGLLRRVRASTRQQTGNRA